MSGKAIEGEGEANAGGCGTVKAESVKMGCKFSEIVAFLYQPVDSSSLGVVRALFGLMMVLDVPHERGLHSVLERFDDPMACHFPLFHWWTPLRAEIMGLLYFIMWIGAVGVCVGYRFRTSCAMFLLPYWYIYLMDKTSWNNHSYLYGLVSVLFLCTCANHSFSVDSLLNKDIKNQPAPLWNYWIIRFQFFLLYFYAGLKKLDADWIGGHSMVSLSKHWVFEPFRLVLTDEQIDLWIIHVFGFLFDLTCGFFLLLDRTRPVAIIFSTSFHLMNSRMFHIGQFPYVCLVTTPIFCSYSWPKQFWKFSAAEVKPEKSEHPTWKQKCVLVSLTAYVAIQLLLPYSHGLTQGYNNWTNGLYGYSWDMMVHNWDTTLITVTVEDHDTGEQHFLEPEAWVRNTRYSKHADMMIQYANCVKRNLQTLAEKDKKNRLKNISIYMDVWCSLNNRFQQRVINPHQDLLTAEWHPLKKTPWVLPLLTELTPWRGFLTKVQTEVLQWNNRSSSLFVADFPGMEMEHYVRGDLNNVTLTVLQGVVKVTKRKFTTTITQGESIGIASGAFHKVVTISQEPSCFFYTFFNASASENNQKSEREFHLTDELVKGFGLRAQNFKKSLAALYACLLKIGRNFGMF